MTEERLAEIRSGLDRYPMPAAKELLAEVDRLRAVATDLLRFNGELIAEVQASRASSPSRESGALLDAAQQEIARFWEIIDRIAEIIGAEESDLDIETAVQMYVDWATGNLAASDAHLSTLERDAARMREDSARLDFLESARCELGHGKYQRHVYPAMPDRTRPDCIGVTLREAIDEARALTPSGEATTTPETSDG